MLVVYRICSHSEMKEDAATCIACDSGSYSRMDSGACEVCGSDNLHPTIEKLCTSPQTYSRFQTTYNLITKTTNYYQYSTNAIVWMITFYICICICIACCLTYCLRNRCVLHRNQGSGSLNSSSQCCDGLLKRFKLRSN